jgi:hypothetical protein
MFATDRQLIRVAEVVIRGTAEFGSSQVEVFALGNLLVLGDPVVDALGLDS